MINIYDKSLDINSRTNDDGESLPRYEGLQLLPGGHHGPGAARAGRPPHPDGPPLVHRVVEDLPGGPGGLDHLLEEGGPLGGEEVVEVDVGVGLEEELVLVVEDAAGGDAGLQLVPGGSRPPVAHLHHPGGGLAQGGVRLVQPGLADGVDGLNVGVREGEAAAGPQHPHGGLELALQADTVALGVPHLLLPGQGWFSCQVGA